MFSFCMAVVTCWFDHARRIGVETGLLNTGITALFFYSVIVGTFLNRNFPVSIDVVHITAKCLFIFISLLVH